jgi:hypothetical protein
VTAQSVLRPHADHQHILTMPVQKCHNVSVAAVWNSNNNNLTHVGVISRLHESMTKMLRFPFRGVRDSVTGTAPLQSRGRYGASYA